MSTTTPKNDLVDLVRSDHAYYTASTTPQLTEIQPVRVAAIEGRGSPGAPEHIGAIQALYAVMQHVQLAAATAPFVVPPLEGLWWCEDDRPWFDVPRDEWRWQLLIRLPDSTTDEWFEVARKRTGDIARDVMLTSLSEGQCVQALHVGPYATEPETLAKMDAFMHREHLAMNGRHHEIYLTPVTEQFPPGETRTILRHPVRAVS